MCEELERILRLLEIFDISESFYEILETLMKLLEYLGKIFTNIWCKSGESWISLGRTPEGNWG